MLNVSVDATSVIAKFDIMPRKVHDALLKKVHELSQMLRNYVIKNKLSGQVLHVRTGKLRRSIDEKVTNNPQSVIGEVFSSGDVKYAAIHEFGGRTPAHIIQAVNGKALAFNWKGKDVFFRSVNHPGSNMPERSFMRSSLKDKTDAIVTGMKQAVEEGTK